MQKEPNKKLIGLFVILGFILFIGIIGHSIISRILTDKKHLVVMYFDESVKGLNVGSPVVFNGVAIGKITQIELLADPATMTFKVPVYAQLTPMKSIKQPISAVDRLWQKKSTLNVMIEKGLRARLLTQSYLTGQLMVELTMIPNSPENLYHNPYDITHNIPEIPTVLSPAGELSKGFQDLPLKRSMEKFEKVLDNIAQYLPIMMPALAETSENLSQITKAAAPATDPTLNNLNQTLYDISDAARSIRNLTDYLERHPESLLRGKGGK